MEIDVNSEIKKIMKGLKEYSNEVIYPSYNQLYSLGGEIIPYIEDILIAYDWKVITHEYQIRVLSLFLSLVNDIDEKKSKELVEKIRTKGTSSPVEACINSIMSFSLDDYINFKIQNVNIYIKKELNDIKNIEKQLNKWLEHIPKQDIKGIDRIYIIPFSTEYNYLGTYTPVLSYIRLAWKGNLPFFIKNIYNELTFYHEVGHHACNHTFCYDEKNEDEADEYARKYIHKNHKVLAGVVKVLKFLKIR